jgi:hypothetical protein
VASTTVLILHPALAADAGPLATAFDEVRRALAEDHRRAFETAGADDVAIVSEPPDDTPFGVRLRRLVRGLDGVVVLGSGSVPLATLADRRAFLAVAASGARRALANSRWSADIMAIGTAAPLAGLPDLDSDNALPRWLAERAGFEVADLAGRWRLGVDLDGPLDVLLTARVRLAGTALRDGAAAFHACAPGLRVALGGVAGVLADRRAEVLVSGRTNARALHWLERATAARVRALVEERGLRASSRLATASPATLQRPPASALGMLLDHEGPGALGSLVARLADAAVVDTRVLLAHRLGADPVAWPTAEDRFASDLLRPDLVTDPWLRELTAAAVSAPVPIVLGGHTLVGPGVRLLTARP